MLGQEPVRRQPRAVVLTPEPVRITQIAGGLEWSLRICIANQLLVLAGLGLWKTLNWM